MEVLEKVNGKKVTVKMTKPLLSNYSEGGQNLQDIELRPYEAIMFELLWE